jgi:SPP1 gp7 family putative phage head morphogenesis protein
MLSQINNLAASAAVGLENSQQAHLMSSGFENGVRDIMTHVFPIFVRILIHLRRASYILAYSGEQEAIGRATQLKKTIDRSEFRSRVDHQMQKPTLAGALDKRVWLCLMNLRRDIVQAFELAVTQGLKAHEIVDKVKSVFPEVISYKRPPKALVKARESDGDPKDGQDWFDFNFIDDGDWNLTVDAYKGTTLPPNRFDNDYPPSYDEETGYNWMSKYNWQLEQEGTEDFVSAVRSGQVEGAQDLGVKEFVWISIIDKKTCEECCLPRNGKTTAEIEQMDDDCDATVPPAHFNCRCNIGPVASTDEVQGPDWNSFNEWLEAA